MSRYATLKDIAAQASRTAQMIRELVRSRQSEWQRVPYLSLQAEGYPHFGSTVLYDLGLWRPHTGNSQEPHIPLVDCATGNLVVVGPGYDAFVNAPDNVVLRLVTSDLLAQYDPDTIIAGCNERAERAANPFSVDYLERKRRELLIRYAHIPQVFTRPQKAA